MSDDIAPGLLDLLVIFNDPRYQTETPPVLPPPQSGTPSGGGTNKTPLPDVFFWTEAQLDIFLGQRTPEGRTEFWRSTSNVSLWKTAAFHEEGDQVQGAIRSYYPLDEYYVPGYSGPSARIRYELYGNRMSWGGGSAGAAGSGGAAAVNVDPAYRVSPYRMLDVDIEKFNVENVLRAGFLPAIRPGDLGGIAHVPSRHATLRVMDIGGVCKYATTNFMLEGVMKAVEEDYRPSSGFEENLLQLHGQKYRLYSFKMVLLDAANFDWARAWDRAWQNYIRASVLAQNKWRCYILCGNRLYGGYPLKYNDNATAQGQPVTDITMVMFITDDEALPSMARVANKQGMVYYKWKGTTFVSGASGNIVDRPIPEYSGDLSMTAEDPEETEYEDEEV